MPHSTAPTPSSSKKRKASHPDSESPKKLSKKSSKTDDSQRESEFQVVNATLVLSVPPIFANNPSAGVEEMLDSMIMRYIPAFRGVVLSHSNLSFSDRKAKIKGDCPFLICNVSFDATVWSPRVGMRLVGKVNLCSPDHISLLMHRTFNVSIPRHHIPLDDWQFEYGPAENDPEFGSGAQETENSEENSEGKDPDDVGKWVHRLTGEKIGDKDGYLEFTVIGLTVANEMLSLQGSIQPDPFDPKHAPPLHPTREEKDMETEQEDIGADAELGLSDEDSDVDPFKLLGQPGTQPQATIQNQPRGESGKQKTSKKKRKLKNDNVVDEGDSPGASKTKRKKLKT